jgi:hypothetical protein
MADIPEVEEALKRQADALHMSVETVKGLAAIMAKVQSFAAHERTPTAILLPPNWGEEHYSFLCGIPVRYTSGVASPTLAFEVEI